MCVYVCVLVVAEVLALPLIQLLVHLGIQVLPLMHAPIHLGIRSQHEGDGGVSPDPKLKRKKTVSAPPPSVYIFYIKSLYGVLFFFRISALPSRALAQSTST